MEESAPIYEIQSPQSVLLERALERASPKLEKASTRRSQFHPFVLEAVSVQCPALL